VSIGTWPNDIVEDVRLLQVVELGPAWRMNCPGREAAVGQVVEEHLVGHQGPARHDAPAGQPVQLLVDAGEVRDAGAMQVQRLQPLQERIAGAARAAAPPGARRA
jgi:hypothetical protein